MNNTNTMIGIRNSVASRFLGKNNEICIVACPCHLAHTPADHGNDGLSNYLNPLFCNVVKWSDTL